MPKYSQRRRADPVESAAKRRQTMKETDERNKLAFWSRFQNKRCYDCDERVYGNDAIAGYCEACREKRNKAFDWEKYNKTQERLREGAREQRLKALRAK